MKLQATFNNSSSEIELSIDVLFQAAGKKEKNVFYKERNLFYHLLIERINTEKAADAEAN